MFCVLLEETFGTLEVHKCRRETNVNTERGSWFTGLDWLYWVNNESNSMGAKVH